MKPSQSDDVSLIKRYSLTRKYFMLLPSVGFCLITTPVDKTHIS